MAESPIEKLENLDEVNVENAGALLLAAILTPIVTFFERSAAFVAAVINFPITVIEDLSTELGGFVVSVIGGSAGIIDASFGAAETGFEEGVYSTLGPIAPTVGVASILGVTALLAWYFSEDATADSIIGLFTATDLPLIGADEDD